MQGFQQAMQEYERHLMCPYDEGGALFDEEEYQREKEDYLEMEAERQMEEIWLEKRGYCD